MGHNDIVITKKTGVKYRFDALTPKGEEFIQLYVKTPWLTLTLNEFEVYKRALDRDGVSYEEV